MHGQIHEISNLINNYIGCYTIQTENYNPNRNGYNSKQDYLASKLDHTYHYVIFLI